MRTIIACEKCAGSGWKSCLKSSQDARVCPRDSLSRACRGTGWVADRAALLNEKLTALAAGKLGVAA
jgi:hypothetical protein